MPQNLKILNSKEVKQIHEQLEQQFGYTEKLDVVFMLSEKKERIYIFNRDLAKLDVANIRIDSMGLYFATMHDGQVRLTIEATQMIGPACTRNVLEVSKSEMQQWMLGEKLMISQLEHQPKSEPRGYVILRHGKHYLGCGKIGGDTILNYIPKTRYIHALYDDVPSGEKPPVTSTELDE